MLVCLTSSVLSFEEHEFSLRSQIDVAGNRKAVVIHVPYRLRKAFRKIHLRLVRELEKKFSGKVSFTLLNFSSSFLNVKLNSQIGFTIRDDYVMTYSDFSFICCVICDVHTKD